LQFTTGSEIVWHAKQILDVASQPVNPGRHRSCRTDRWFYIAKSSYLQTAAGAIALALGFWGWMIEKPPADFRGMLDNVFRTVQLITLQFPTDLNSSPNYQLQIARLAVPVVATLATFQVLIASITRPARLALLPYTSGHIVVCGSAQITQSALKTLASRRQQVVVVGSDAGDRDVLEGFGLTVLEGDPLQEATLRSADLSRAAACLVLGDDDVENLNIAMQALPAWTSGHRLFRR
jgi:TrkA-N domain